LKVNGRLEKYVKKFNGLVRLFRNKKHEGLIQSRMNGVKQSNSEVVVILDAHVECVDNWLPPLLSVIKADRLE
jgi:polypeptide N-acetylgalactosaminyltransferase